MANEAMLETASDRIEREGPDPKGRPQEPVQLGQQAPQKQADVSAQPSGQAAPLRRPLFGR
jgi:hypothetical protein